MIKLIINPRDKSKIRKAIKRVILQIRSETRNMPRRCSHDAVSLLRGNINKQVFAPYAPYSERYRKWKSERGYPLIFWKLKGDLIMAIKSHRITSGMGQEVQYLAGISSTAYDSGAKDYYGRGPRKRIAEYARILEFGGSFGKGGNHPARPLFRPTARQYRHGAMINQGVKSLRNIANKWY